MVPAPTKPKKASKAPKKTTTKTRKPKAEKSSSSSVVKPPAQKPLIKVHKDHVKHLHKLATKPSYRTKDCSDVTQRDGTIRKRFVTATGTCVFADSGTLQKLGQCPPKTKQVVTKTGQVRTKTVYYIPNPKFKIAATRKGYQDPLNPGKPAPRACIKAGGQAARAAHGKTAKVCDPYHQVWKKMTFTLDGKKYTSGRCVKAKKDLKQCEQGQALYGLVTKAGHESYRCFRKDKEPKGWTFIADGTLPARPYKRQTH